MNTENTLLTNKSAPDNAGIGRESSPTEYQSMDEVLMQRLHKVVNANLSNEQFSVEDLASEVALSRSHLHRKLSKLTGQSISLFIREIRLDYAYHMLKKEVGTVSEIAYKVGFGSSSYFIKCFSDAYGFSPGEVKKRVEANEQEVTESQSVNSPLPKSKPSLELLHPAASENMIHEVFETLVKFKPSLEKFLTVDDEEGETVDSRLLAYQIFKNYPWPIGVEVRRLFSIALIESSDKRLVQLEKMIFRTARLLFFVLVSELIRLKQLKKVRLGQEEKTKLIDSLETNSKESLIDLFSVLAEKLTNAPSDFFEHDLIETFDSSFIREIEDWKTLSSHFDSNTSHDQVIALEQIATFMLKKAGFLLKYKFVNISSIQVLKGKFSNASFQHNIHLLNNSEPDFKLQQEVMSQFSDSHAVLLMKSIKNAQDYINLSPFVIDTHNDIDPVDTSSRIQKDIYLLDKIENGQLQFIGTEVTGSVDLTSLKSYTDLQIEYTEMVKILKQ